MLENNNTENYLWRLLENRLADYRITHLTILDVRPEGADQIVADLSDTRNQQIVKILIDRATGHFLDVDIEPVQTG